MGKKKREKIEYIEIEKREEIKKRRNRMKQKGR